MMKKLKYYPAVALVVMMALVFMLFMSGVNGVAAEGDEFYAVFNTAAEGDNPANTLSFYYDGNKASHEGVTGKTVYTNLPTEAEAQADWGYNSIKSDIKNVVIDKSVEDYHDLQSTAFMFSGMTNADNISGCEYLDVSNVTNMSSTFRSFASGNQKAYSEITVVPDVSKWNTENVTNMESMFHLYANYSNITAVPDVSGWNTKNVTNMKNMFRCFAQNSTSFTAVPNVSEWDTGSVENMNGVFYMYAGQSTAITAVPNVSGWNTDSVTDMGYMFSNYAAAGTGITAVPDVLGWNTKNVTNMASMFAEYAKASTSKLDPLDLSEWDINKLEDSIKNTTTYPAAGKMFNYYNASCSSGNPVVYAKDWSTIKTEGVTASDMFTGSKLKNAGSVTSDENQWAFANTGDTGCFTTPPVASITTQSGTTKYATVQEAVNAANAGETVKLLFDVDLTSTIDIANGKNLTIDFNGKTLDGKNIPVPTANGQKASVIHINANATLTLDDSSTGTPGKITGGKGYLYGARDKYTYGGGVCMIDGGTLNLYKISITGNTANYGGGVYARGGTINMYSGKISNNNVHYKLNSNNLRIGGYGGGVMISAQEGADCYVNMYGGEISGNSVDSDSGGVHLGGRMKFQYPDYTLSYNTILTVSGAAKITGNIYCENGITKPANVHVQKSAPIVIGQDGLEPGAEIGVKFSFTTTGTRAFTTNGTADDLQYFTSDNQACKVKYVEATEGESPVAAHLELVDYDLNQIASNTASISLENDAMTAEQAIGIAKELMPYGDLTDVTVIAYAKSSDFDTNSKYCTIKADSSTEWAAYNDKTLAELKALVKNNYAKCFVIGTTHAHSFTYEVSETNKTITATCSESGCGLTESKVVATLAAENKEYTKAVYAGASISGKDAWDAAESADLTLEYVGRDGTTYTKSATAPTNAGKYTVTMTASDKTVSADFEITKKQLTVSGTTVQSTKEYDGTTDAEVTAQGTLAGIIGTEDVSLDTVTAAYADKNAGTGKTVTVVYTIKGADKDNYIAPVNNTSFTANITKKQLTVSGTTVNDKTYDSTDAATADIGEVEGIISGDSVTVTVKSANFSNKTAEAAKEVTVKYEVSGTDAGNYSVPADDNKTATISKRVLSVKDTVVADKVYDGTTTAQITTKGTIIPEDEFVEDEDVEIDTATGVFDQSDVKTDICVIVSFTLKGNDKDNYDVSDCKYYADITPVTITVTPDANQSKIYGGEDPTLTYTSKGAISGETAAFTGALNRVAGKNVKEAGYAITIGSLALEDNGAFKAANYTLELNETPVIFTINKKSITGAEITLKGGVLLETGEELTQEVESVGMDGWKLDITYDVTENKATNAGTYKLKVAGNGNYEGTVEVPFVILEATKSEEEVTPISEKITVKPCGEEGGKVTLEVKQAKDAPKTEIKMSANDLLAAAASADDFKRIAQGENISIWVEIKKSSKAPSKEAQKAIEKLLFCTKVCYYMDITIYKQVEGENATQLTNTNEGTAIVISTEVAEDLRQESQKLGIIRYHQVKEKGEAKALEVTYDADSAMISFKSGEFSVYALTMDVIPETGDHSNVMLYVIMALLAMGAISTMVVTRMKAKR